MKTIYFVFAEHDSRLREVAIIAGGEVYMGDIEISAKEISLQGVNKLVKRLSKLHENDPLSLLCGEEEIPKGDCLFRCYQELLWLSKSIFKELTSDELLQTISKMSSSTSWLESEAKDGIYFEISLAKDFMKEYVDMIAYSTYAGSQEMSLVYIRGKIYVKLSDASGKTNNLVNKRFPKLTKQGYGLQLISYDLIECETHRLSKIVVWNSSDELVNVGVFRKKQINKELISGSTNFRTENAEIDPNVVKKSEEQYLDGSYIQTYYLGKKMNSEGQRKVLFSFGNWCYEGIIELNDTINLHMIPHILRKFQQQQNKLAFTFETPDFPKHNFFFADKKVVYNLSAIMIHYVTSSEDALTKLDTLNRKVTKNNSWISHNTGKQYYEAQLTEHSLDSELIANKIYIQGLVVILLFHGQSVYLTLNNAKGDQPLLDMSFPDVSTKSRGYLLFTFKNSVVSKFMVWEGERSIWETANKIVLNQAAEKIKQTIEQKNDRDKNNSERPSKGKERIESKQVEESEIRQVVLKRQESSEVDIVPESKIEEKSSLESKVFPNMKGPHRIRPLGKRVEKEVSKLPLLQTKAPWDSQGKPFAVKKNIETKE
eukprot:snap_masked-scaffold_31-processed-gene-3.52-mRNA-1 protein AED:1.00 eAED:1.00 QI:0/0/0/0/1/1/2/0/597